MGAMADVSQNVVPSREGLGQWVNSTKTAEPINVRMPFRGLTHAGSRNSVLVG